MKIKATIIIEDRQISFEATDEATLNQICKFFSKTNKKAKLLKWCYFSAIYGEQT